MAIRSALARWEGDLKEGRGTMRLENGAYEGQYSFSSRFEEGAGTNPEELIAAAHAGCFSMALSNGLATAGHKPQSVETTARVHLEKGSAGFHIPRIELECLARVPGMDEKTFHQEAEKAKQNCPVSKLFKADITLKATLLT